MHISDGVLHPATLAGGFVVGGALAAWGLTKIEDRDYPRVGIMTAAFFGVSIIHVPLPPVSVHLTLNSVVGIALGPRCFPAMMTALILQALLLGNGGITSLGVNTVVMSVPGFLAGYLMRWGLARGKPGHLPFCAAVFLVFLAAIRMGAASLREMKIIGGSIPWPAILAIAAAFAGTVAVLQARLRAGAVFRWGFTSGTLAVFGAALMLFCVLAFMPLARHQQREAFRNLAYFTVVAHAPIMFVEGLLVAFVARYVAVAAPEILAIEKRWPLGANAGDGS